MFHKILAVLMVPIVFALVLASSSTAAGASYTGTGMCFGEVATQKITGQIHGIQTDRDGNVTQFEVGNQNPPFIVKVQPPNPGATADINSHNGQNATVKYHDSGTPAQHIFEGFDNP